VTASFFTTVSSSPGATEGIAREIAEVLQAGDVVVLTGDLGAGKTTFARGLADGLGVVGPVVSPTFTLAREYRGRLPMLHVDLYRLDRAQEVIDLGLEDLADDDAVIVVEWGDIAAAYLPGDERLEVRIERGPGDDERAVTLTPLGPSWLTRNRALGDSVGRASGAA
jgi:tRNA threonylcarbamoyladenosine biosynthesis protein TsaE